MKFLMLVTSSFLLVSLAAQEKLKNNEVELFDQKFIYENSICSISKKEQETAKAYAILSEDKQYNQLKLPLTIIQLRLINGATFLDINCSLRYFIEQFKSNIRNRYGYDSNPSVSAVIADYLSILEKLRTDVKTKSDYEDKILNSNQFLYYYSVISKKFHEYNLIDINIARKIYSNLLLSKDQKMVSEEEWQTLFNLYYLKNVAPPKVIHDYIKSTFSQKNTNSHSLGSIYLANVNDFSYNDLFKSLLESTGPQFVSNFFINYNFSIEQVRQTLQSPYYPDSFKCNYAKEIISKQASKLSREAIEEIQKMNVACVNEALVDAIKFSYPVNGCPQILFDKNEDKASLISKISHEYSNAWIDCRKKCNAGDICLPVQEPSGLYSFINSKYEKDIPVLKNIKARFSSNMEARVIPNRYDYKPLGMCSEHGSCEEKVNGCLESDIIKKLNAELKAANLQSCNQDSDCKSVPVGISGCTDFAVNWTSNENADVIVQSSNSSMGRTFVHHPQGFTHFLSFRAERLATRCGVLLNMWPCMERQRNNKFQSKEVKCIKKQCVVSK